MTSIMQQLSLENRVSFNNSTASSKGRCFTLIPMTLQAVSRYKTLAAIITKIVLNPIVRVHVDCRGTMSGRKLQERNTVLFRL